MARREADLLMFAIGTGEYDELMCKGLPLEAELFLKQSRNGVEDGMSRNSLVIGVLQCQRSCRLWLERCEKHSNEHYPKLP